MLNFLKERTEVVVLSFVTSKNQIATLLRALGCHKPVICGNVSDTSSLKFARTRGSIGHAFTVCIRTENQNQVSFNPFVLHDISVLIELTLGHLCYRLTDVPPQPNSPPDVVSRSLAVNTTICLGFSLRTPTLSEPCRLR